MALEATVENVEVVELQHERDARHERQRSSGQGRQQQPIAAILVLPRVAAQLGVFVYWDVHSQPYPCPPHAPVIALPEDPMVGELHEVGRKTAVERVRDGSVREEKRTDRKSVV